MHPQASIQVLPPLPPHLENEDLDGKEKRLLQICMELQVTESDARPLKVMLRAEQSHLSFSVTPVYAGH